MGNTSSCPPGFQSGFFLTCSASCPAGFKYVQDPGQPPTEKCVHLKRNEWVIQLTPQPVPVVGQPLPLSYAAETQRVKKEAESIAERDQLDEKKQVITRDHSRIQSEYAAFDSSQQGLQTLREVSKSLTPLRPPTAPESDIEIERQKILNLQANRLLFIQIALALVVFALITYMTFPVDIAHGVAFILLSLGISFGFFLRK